MKILEIDDLSWESMDDLHRRAFVRVDFNVPIKDGKVLDDYRIKQVIPTIRDLLKNNCIVVLAAHLGRPLKSKESKDKFSLISVGEKLAELLDHDVIFSEDLYGSGLRKLIQDGRGGKTIILLENLRLEEGEEANDKEFAEKIFQYCDFYVNDAFGACHRAHASIEAITHLSKVRCMGRLLAKEVHALDAVLTSAIRPQMAILGGAKIADKILVIKSLFENCSHIFVGGRMGQTFLAAQGKNLGASSIETEALPLARRLMAEARQRKVEFIFPVDGRAASAIDASSAEVRKIEDIGSLGFFDIGPATIENWKPLLKTAKQILWNGPMGVFENPTFAEGTLGLVDFLVSIKNETRTIAGGGETVAAITQRGALESLYHVSTGGGAMLEYLEGKEMPGIEALKLKDREVELLKATPQRP